MASGKESFYNSQLLTLMAGYEVRITHGHVDALMPHELLQLHQRNLSGLSQPRCKSMSHGMQSDGIEWITVLGFHFQISNCGTETGRRFGEGDLFAGLLKDRFLRFPSIGQEHFYHILRNTDRCALSAFGNNVQHPGVGVYILPLQTKHFRGAQACLEGEQHHIMKLGMSGLKVRQQSFGLFPGQEAKALVVDLDHLPVAALGGEWIDALPHADSDGPVYGRPHETEDIIHRCPGKAFPQRRAPHLAGILSLGVTGRHFEEFGFDLGEKVGVQISDRQIAHGIRQMGTVLTVMLVNVLSFRVPPCYIGINGVTNSYLIALDGIDAGCFHLSQKLRACLAGSGGANAFAVPADRFPVVFAFGIDVPEAVHLVELAGDGISLGGDAVEDALVFSSYEFSASCVIHGETVAAENGFGKETIQILSKTDFPRSTKQRNHLVLIIIFSDLLSRCDRERERVTSTKNGKPDGTASRQQPHPPAG